MTNSPPVGKKFSFDATLEDWAEGMDYCAVPVPARITKALGTKAAVLVMAQVNDSKPFKVSLFPVGGGKHYIRIKASVRKETKTKTGDRIKLTIKILDRDDVEIPDDLMIAMRAEGLVKAFLSLPPGKRNYMVRRIEDAVRPETRKKRIQEALDTAVKRR